jgi:hypothetical protein
MRPVKAQRKSAIGSTHNIALVYLNFMIAKKRCQKSIDTATC